MASAGAGGCGGEGGGGSTVAVGAVGGVAVVGVTAAVTMTSLAIAVGWLNSDSGSVGGVGSLPMQAMAQGGISSESGF